MTAATRIDALEPLMPRIAAGDRLALREFYDRTSAKLFGVCLRILVDREDAEDVLQDVYLTIWRRADRFEAHRGAAVTWASSIARNRAIDRLRSRGPLAGAQEIEGLEIVDERPGAETQIEDAEAVGRLHGCLSALDERTQSVIRTAYFEGVTYDALSRRLGAPLGTVKSWVRRGLARLKACLEP